MNISQPKLRSEKFDNTNKCKEVRLKLDKKQWYDHVPKSDEPRHDSNQTWNQHVKADRTIPNHKPDNTLRDNGKRTCLKHSNLQRRNCNPERRRNYFKIPRDSNINIAYVECENKSDTSNNTGRNCLCSIFGKRNIQELH